MCISVKAHRLNKLPLATALTWLTAMCFILSEWDGASTLHNSPANPLWIRNGSFSWSCTHEQVTRGKHSLVTFWLAPTHILYHLQPSSPELLGRHSMTEATGLNGERLCTVHPALHRHDVMMTSSHMSPSPQGERFFPTGEDPWGVKLPQPCICSLDDCICPLSHVCDATMSHCPSSLHTDVLHMTSPHILTVCHGSSWCNRASDHSMTPRTFWNCHLSWKFCSVTWNITRLPRNWP